MSKRKQSVFTYAELQEMQALSLDEKIADVNRILAEQTLARRFDLIIFIVNQYGEEKCQTYKETKKKFLSSFNNNSSFRVN